MIKPTFLAHSIMIETYILAAMDGIDRAHCMISRADYEDDLGLTAEDYEEMIDALNKSKEMLKTQLNRHFNDQALTRRILERTIPLNKIDEDENGRKN